MRQKTREFAVIGLGRFGSAVALKLEALGHKVLGIDDNMEIVQRLATRLSHVVTLDATNEAALRNIDIAEFPTVIIAIGTDFESNLMTTVALKEIGVKKIVCKAITRRQADILLKVGATQAILPEFEAGERLAEELVNPSLLSRFHLDPEYSIAEITAPTTFTHQTIAQLDLRRQYGINVLLVKRDKQVITSPRADLVILTGDLLVILARDEKIELLSQMVTSVADKNS